MFNVRPDHDPTPVPAGTTPGLFDVPVTEKSAWVHAGLVLSAWTLKAVTLAVTLETVTGPVLPLSNLPDSATLPPGVRLLDDDVCTTVTFVPAAVVAEPVPDPAPVQYPNAATATAPMTARPATFATSFFLLNRIVVLLGL